ncbi:MAG: BREX-1 system adenine-specific DNA-methyltransferase PglX, partial [Candidatus Entotheonellia bacterium]
LYQFYISEKKDQVVGKVVKSEDIPAATQLFTPNWIVKYLVQNSLGRQWMATYPNSPLRQQMEYYIEPAEQTQEVQEQLKAITPDSLNPEELTLLDPACGSGHILVEAYDLLKAIYQERGYRASDIPRLILEKNLYGLEIDDRAAQLAAFALMMKARADDRRIFSSGIQPHVLSIQESKGLDAEELTRALNVPILKEKLPPSAYLFEEIEGERSPLLSRKNLSVEGEISQASVAQLLDLFEHGKTFGSLIRVPGELAKTLPTIAERVQDVLTYGDMMEQAAATAIRPFVEQARILATKYDAVVANPPYMGTKFYAPNLKAFIRREYKRSQGDLYTCFMIRNLALARSGGLVGMITIPNWMFLSSFDELRDDMLGRGTIDTFIHNGRGVFGSDFGSCSFVVRNHCNDLFSGSYRRLFEKQGSVADNEELERRFFAAPTYTARQSDFRSIPGQPIAYWISERMRQCFRNGTPLGEIAELGQGMATSDNGRFLRRWHEVGIDKVGVGYQDRAAAKASRLKWFPYNKGGECRRWFGNNEYLVNWENDGSEVLAYAAELYGSPTRTIKNISQYFRPALTWTDISSSFFGVRCSDPGFLFDVSGSSAFPPDEWRECIAGFMACKIASSMLAVLNPTMHFQVGNVSALPVLQPQLLARKSAIDGVVLERRCSWLAPIGTRSRPRGTSIRCRCSGIRRPKCPARQAARWPKRKPPPTRKHSPVSSA